MPAFFFFNDTATTEIYTLSLHDALPIYVVQAELVQGTLRGRDLRRTPVDDHQVGRVGELVRLTGLRVDRLRPPSQVLDRKSTRLNSSHQIISYAVFCLKKKK